MHSNQNSTASENGIKITGLLVRNARITQRFVQVAGVLGVLLLAKFVGQVVPEPAYLAFLVSRGDADLSLASAAFAASAPSDKYQRGTSAMRRRGDAGDPNGCNLKCPKDGIN